MHIRSAVIFVAFATTSMLLSTPTASHALKTQARLSSANGIPEYEIIRLPTQYSTNYGAKAINDKGVIVGTYWIPPNPAIVHAMLWRDGVLSDLGTLGGAVSVALDINNQSEVVGSSEIVREPNTRLDTTHAFLW